MDQKQCSSCREILPSSRFYNHAGKKTGLSSDCKQCFIARRNTPSAKEKARASKQQQYLRKRKIIVEAMREGCVDCGITDIRVLQFDHVDASNKIDTISNLIRDKGLKSILIELKKCAVRCANCHVLKTLERIGYSWHDEFMVKQ